MATGLLDVKRRLNTTRQLRKVTSTLQKVAAARLTSSRRQLGDADVYFDKLCQLLGTCYYALPAGAPVHPLMQERPGGSIALIVFGSDRGLCGTFNTVLMNETDAFRKAHAGRDIQLLLRGKVVYRRAMRREWTGIRAVEDVDGIILQLMDDFLNGPVSEVHVLYFKYLGGINHEVRREQLLPTPFTSQLAHAQVDTTFDADMLEPGPAAIIDRLLPAYVRQSIHSCYYNSMAAENAARQASMSRATENAGELITDLSRQYSRLRQESITTEMLELVSGMGAA